MVILDTNILSEPSKPEPSPAVLAWILAQPRKQQYTTTVTQAEMWYGAERLPAGKRRDTLLAEIVHTFEVGMAGRILSFDEVAARLYPGILIARQRSGRPIQQLDAMIAAIAKAHNAVLATRNALDFEGCGVRVVDPFSYTDGVR